MKKIKFIQSPLDLGLGYSQGEEGEFLISQADELISLGLAIEVVETIENTDKIEPKKEKAIKK